MAASEWTRKVLAVRDFPVVDYSGPSVDTTCHVANRIPIAVSLFLLALSDFYFKQTLWYCGQLWPYVGMGSLGTRLDRDCNAMGDGAKIFPNVPSTLSSTSITMTEDMILPGREDLRNCVDPWNRGKSEWDQMLGMIESVLSLYDKMKWKWDAVYLPRGLPNIYFASLIPPPLPMYLHTPTVSPWRHSWRPWSIECGDALGGCDRESLEMLLGAEIEWTQKMHLEAMINRVWRCTLRLWPSEFGDALAGYDWARLEEYLEAVDLEGGATAAETLFIGYLVIVGMWRVEYNSRREMRNWLGVGDCRSWDDAVLGVCCTWCML